MKAVKNISCDLPLEAEFYADQENNTLVCLFVTTKKLHQHKCCIFHTFTQIIEIIWLRTYFT